jgi:hypothetical protein
MQRETGQTESSITTAKPDALRSVHQQDPPLAHAISPKTEKVNATLTIISSSSSSHPLAQVETIPSTGGEYAELDPQDDTMETPDNEVGLLKLALSDNTRSDEEPKRILGLLQGLTRGKTYHRSDTASELESARNATSDAANIEPAFPQYHNPWDDFPSDPESKACSQRCLAHTLGDGVNQTDDLAYRYGQVDDTVFHEDVLCVNPWAD